MPRRKLPVLLTMLHSQLAADHKTHYCYSYNIQFLSTPRWVPTTVSQYCKNVNNNNNNNNNNHDDIYSAVIIAEPLQEFTRFTR